MAVILSPCLTADLSDVKTICNKSIVETVLLGMLSDIWHY
jgi:hypothetical protein